jgi:hypothetical protein
MKWIDTLEARFGHVAVDGLLRYVAGLNLLTFALCKFNPEFLKVLALDPAAVLHGQVWRLVTYIFIPSFGGFFPDWLGVVLWVYYLWWIGDGLEHAWGAFKLNLFYLLGMIGTTIAAFVSHAAFSSGMPSSLYSNGALNGSLFFAFARFYPEMWIYLMWVLPVKVKWIAWVSAAALLLQFATGSNAFRLATLAALGNYLIFFGPEIVHDARHRRDVTTRRRRFERDLQAGSSESLHRCAVCNKTEVSDPDLDFRVAKDGNEYCTEHLPRVNVQA